MMLSHILGMHDFMIQDNDVFGDAIHISVKWPTGDDVDKMTDRPKDNDDLMRQRRCSKPNTDKWRSSVYTHVSQATGIQ